MCIRDRANTFQSIVRQTYCRTCHIAQNSVLTSYADAREDEFGANCQLCHIDEFPKIADGTTALNSRLTGSVCGPYTEPDGKPGNMPNANITHLALFNAIAGTRPYANSGDERQAAAMNFVNAVCREQGGMMTPPLQR